MAQPRTLFEKIWDSHVVAVEDDGTCLLYIDRHLTHEVTTPQPYEGLRQTGRKVRRPDATLAGLPGALVLNNAVTAVAQMHLRRAQIRIAPWPGQLRVSPGDRRRRLCRPVVFGTATVRHRHAAHVAAAKALGLLVRRHHHVVTPGTKVEEVEHRRHPVGQ